MRNVGWGSIPVPILFNSELGPRNKMLRAFFFNGKDRITLPARVEDFEVLRQWLLQIAQELKLHQAVSAELCIAVDEIFTNIASYAYPGHEGTVEITIALDTDEQSLQITFIDNGIPYDPVKMATPPDITLSTILRKPGGFGIFLVKNIMDELTYTRQDDKNILRMAKKINK